MKLRLPEAALEIGDVAVHGEEAYPSEDLVSISAAARAADPLSPISSSDSLQPEKAAKTTEDT